MDADATAEPSPTSPLQQEEPEANQGNGNGNVVHEVDELDVNSTAAKAAYKHRMDCLVIVRREQWTF